MLDGSRFKKETPFEVLAYIPAAMLVIYSLVRVFA